MHNLIEAQNIDLILGKKSILKQVSLAIKPHDFMTIIGPNGAGKSMLLKLLLGLLAPTRGLINRQAGLEIGYMPQRFIQDQTMPITVRRFLSLNQRGNIQDMAAIFEKTHIDHLTNQMLYDLSGGELQRVLLARALLRKPDLLILDEPAQNLDLNGQLQFYKLLESLYQQSAMTIIMVSHDLHMVMASSKQVVCLYHHICCSGAPNIVAKDPEFIALFGKEMADMMAVYHHHHDHNHDDHNHHNHNHRNHNHHKESV